MNVYAFCYYGLVILSLWYGKTSSQTTDLVTTSEGSSYCPDKFELYPCNCYSLSSDVQILDCSKIENENQLANVFETTFFPNTSYALVIKGNENLTFMSSNVFGDVAFVSVDLIDDAIEYIDQLAFENSYRTLENWGVKRCNLLPQGFPFSSLRLYSSLITLTLDAAGKFEVLPKLLSDSIVYLDVINGDVTYLHEEAFYGLQNLTFLNLNGNRISSLASGQFDRNALLYSIYLSNNEIRELVGGTFKNLEKLAYIEIGYNRIGHIKPASFYNLPELRMIYLHYNNLQYFLAEDLGFLPALLDIGIYNNDIQYLDKDLLLGCFKPRSVFADNNNLTTIMPGTFDKIETGFIMLSSNLLTVLGEDWLRTPLEQGDKVDILGNPLACGCEISWLFLNTTLMMELSATCGNGTNVQDLDPSFFVENC